MAKLTDCNVTGLICFWEDHCYDFLHSFLDWVYVKIWIFFYFPKERSWLLEYTAISCAIEREMTLEFDFVAERTSYFCLACKLIWPLWLSNIFTQWGWLILFSLDYFPWQHNNGVSPPNFLFLRIFWVG